MISFSSSPSWYLFLEYYSGPSWNLYLEYEGDPFLEYQDVLCTNIQTNKQFINLSLSLPGIQSEYRTSGEEGWDQGGYVAPIPPLRLNKIMAWRQPV